MVKNLSAMLSPILQVREVVPEEGVFRADPKDELQRQCG